MTLQEFYFDEKLRKEVQSYFLDYLKLQAIEKAFSKESTEHIGEAKEVLDKAFDNLEYLFAKGSSKKEQKNQSR
jgi:hypothetical protein